MEVTSAELQGSVLLNILMQVKSMEVILIKFAGDIKAERVSSTSKGRIRFQDDLNSLEN